jgi:thioredoxin-related protein
MLKNKFYKRYYISFLLILSLFSFAKASQVDNIKFNLEKEKIKKGEKVCFSIENNSKEIIYLPSTAPWVIIDAKTQKIIYSPIASQMIVKLRPKNKKRWCWNQKDLEGNEVPTGTYQIRITIFTKKGKREFLQLPLVINPEYK